MKKNLVYLFTTAIVISSCGEAENKTEKNNQDIPKETSSIKQDEEKPEMGLDLQDGMSVELVIDSTLMEEQTGNDAIATEVDSQNAQIENINYPSNSSSNATEVNSSTKEEQVASDNSVMENTSNPSNQDAVGKEEVVEEKPLDRSNVHLQWDALLKKYVSSSGKVNYKGFKSDKAALEAYCNELAKETPSSSWSKNEKLAYWINAYNVFTVKLIIENYPLKSIMDIPNAWDKKDITLAGKKYGLGQIENEILRKMNEPRIHFAINCASESCPNIYNRAFLSSKMSSQLKLVTKSFFNDASKNDFSGKKSVKISKLFEWYAADFNGGDIIAYINSNTDLGLSDKTKIEFLEYDWSLNE